MGKKKTTRKRKENVVQPKTLKEEIEEKKVPELSDDEKMQIEREIRKYVRKDGGYRKGLADKEMAHCAILLRKVGRKPEDGWNRDIVIPGMDNPSVSDIKVI